MRWPFVLINPDGSAIGALTAAKSRKLTVSLDDAATASFSIDGQEDQAALVQELETDLLIYDDKGIKRFRGRMGTSGDTVSAPGHSCTFSAVDYRGFLARRIIWPGSTTAFTTVDQALIAWTLIADSQSLAGGDLGITRGLGQTTGVERVRNYKVGTVLGTLLTQLGDVITGFDWEIDPTLAFNVFYPQRGVDSGLTLAYPGRILSFKRQVPTTGFANAIRYAGATTLTPATAEATTYGPTGRWEAAIGDTSILDQSTLTQKAAYELDQDQTITPSYTVTLDPRWWTPDKLWLGDSAQLVLKSGRLDEVTSGYRVTQIEIDFGDDGGITPNVTFGPIIPDFIAIVAAVAQSTVTLGQTPATSRPLKGRGFHGFH